MAMAMGPPPADLVQQQQGPFSMAAAQQQQQPPQGQPQPGQQQGQAPPGEPLEGQLIVASIHIREMLKTDPSFAPWANQAIQTLETGVRTLLAQRRQAGGGGMPMESATPTNEPGAGLPF